jgi:hypothetical protein
MLRLSGSRGQLVGDRARTVHALVQRVDLARDEHHRRHERLLALVERRGDEGRTTLIEILTDELASLAVVGEQITRRLRCLHDLRVRALEVFRERSVVHPDGRRRIEQECRRLVGRDRVVGIRVRDPVDRHVLPHREAIELRARDLVVFHRHRRWVRGRQRIRRRGSDRVRGRCRHRRRRG